MGETEKLQSEALAQFTAQNYEQCLSAIHKLLKVDDKRKNDPRVQQNTCVAEFLKGGCVDIEKLRQDFGSLSKLDAKPLPRVAEQKEDRFLCLEFDGHEVVLYNEAVLWYHSHQHAEAVRILRPMFDYQEMLPQPIAVRSALLLVACLLSLGQAADIAPMLTYLESQKEFMATHDDQLAKDPTSAPLCRAPLLQQYAILQAHVSLSQKQLSGCTAGLQSVLRAGSQSSFLPTLHYNNLGVAHLRVKKPQLASLYFAKAVESYDQYKAQLPFPDTTGSCIPRVGSAMCHVLYNNAVCLLMREKYELAFRSLVVATPLLHMVPSLWLRLAQCCVKLHETNVRRERAEHKDSTSVASGGVIHTRTTVHGTVYHLPVRGSTMATTFQMSVPPNTESNHMSLTFADKCLRNAHYLLLQQGRLILASTGRAPQRSTTPVPEGESPPPAEEASPRPASTEEVLDALARDASFSPILQAVYVNMAYVALAMNNPSVALHEAKQLLGMANCSKENKIVTLSYVAEALCWLNKPGEALPILHGVNAQELLSDKLVEVDRHHAEALFVNLAIVHIMQGKYQRAQECVKKFISGAAPGHSILIQIYLDLVQGNRDRVVELLRKHSQNFASPL